MRLPKFDYAAPESLPEALSLFSGISGEALLLAGGTDLVVRLRQRVAAPRLLISLNSLSAMDYISRTPEGNVRIGALARLHSLETSPLLRGEFGILAQAASKVASAQIRNVATLGGNLGLDTRCWFYNKSQAWRRSWPACFKTGGTLCHVVTHGKRCYALFSGDMAPALISLGARVMLSGSKGDGTIPLKNIYSSEGRYPLKLSPGEIITGVEVPRQCPNSGGTYLKYSFREAVDFAVASVAASISVDRNGGCTEASIVIGAVSSAPVKASKVEGCLKGNQWSPELVQQAAGLVLKDVGAVVSIGAPVDYKKKVINYLVRQAIAEAWESAKARAATPNPESSGDGTTNEHE